MAAPRIIVISGNGFNCERETRYAFEMCGGKPDIIHMNDLIAGDVSLSDYQIIAFIGGFSYGDHLGGGKVASNKFRNHLSDKMNDFINRDTLIIGICNGFQVITQLGILPGFDNDYSSHLLTLSANYSARYEDRWVHLKANSKSPCLFTRNIQYLYLPVRHGEGNLFALDKTLIKKLKSNNQVSMQYIDPNTNEPTQEYPHNPNGSIDAIAGICDPTGRIFGLMPHPEAYLSPYNNPSWTRLKVHGKIPEEGDGVQIFRNAVNYFN